MTGVTKASPGSWGDWTPSSWVIRAEAPVGGMGEVGVAGTGPAPISIGRYLGLMELTCRMRRVTCRVEGGRPHGDKASQGQC